MWMLPIITCCFQLWRARTGTNPGQIRRPAGAARRLDYGPASGTVLATVVPPPPGEWSSPKTLGDSGRAAGAFEKTNQEIDQLVAEAHARLPRHLAKSIGAVYSVSTWMQDSAEDQVRAILAFAVENGIFVPREHIYFDLGVRGHKNKRDGLDQLRAALRAKKAKALLLFATNQLSEKCIAHSNLSKKS